MARGRRYPLIVYQHMLNRWWPAMITMGLGMFALAYAEYIDPLAQFIAWRWQLFAVVGGLAILIGIFLIVIRHFAYVQVFPSYLKLVTPFLRLNISFRRIMRTTTSEMGHLFPRRNLSWWNQEILAPLASLTAMVIELNSYPISRTVLQLFLSKFFFKDRTPHLVILVNDWMLFSAELESMRSNTDPNPPGRQKRVGDSILSRLPQK
ncbi:MAG TPA: hypothetical protein VJ785_15620 [Anaerolineales bacterium]|nr:hypothetical protein [Anaerolineales bacterium]